MKRQVSQWKDRNHTYSTAIDFIAIITSFCCRLYGLRRSQHKKNKIKEILNQPDEDL